jgi:hypothetical protein
LAGNIDGLLTGDWSRRATCQWQHLLLWNTELVIWEDPGFAGCARGEPKEE